MVPVLRVVDAALPHQLGLTFDRQHHVVGRCNCGQWCSPHASPASKGFLPHLLASYQAHLPAALSVVR